MDTKSKVKSFFKGVLGAFVFVVVFSVVLGAILMTTHPQRLLNNFEEETITHGYLDNKDGFYLGDLSGGKITGEGQYVLMTGSSYNGAWNINESPEGKGVLVIKDIGKYDGEFFNGIREGNGTFTWDNGDKYSGDWLNDGITGTGTITYANGNSLTGTFENNTLTSGTFTAKLDIGTLTITIGGYSSNDAILKLTDGTKYTGTLSNGKFTGDCTINYANGDKYEGKVSENVKSGYGTYTWKNNASYVGNWSNDKMNGTGTYYYTSSSYGKRLKGEFKDNHPTGSVIYYDADGDDYKTTWSGGKCIKVERN